MARCSHVGKDLPSVTSKVHFGYKGKLEDLTMGGTLRITIAWTKYDQQLGMEDD